MDAFVFVLLALTIVEEAGESAAGSRGLRLTVAARWLVRALCLCLEALCLAFLNVPVPLTGVVGVTAVGETGVGAGAGGSFFACPGGSDEVGDCAWLLAPCGFLVVVVAAVGWRVAGAVVVVVGAAGAGAAIAGAGAVGWASFFA